LSSSDPVVAATQRWRLDVAYDGAAFRGFAEQPNKVTVVGELARVLAVTLRLTTSPTMIGAGRTDAGVHAFAQVVHVDLPHPLYARGRGSDVARLLRSVNKQLAGRLVVTNARPVTDEFHARFSASWRAYRYLVIASDSPALDLTSRLAWTVKGPLHLEDMNRASGELVGTHDFRSFCRRPAGSDAGEPLLRTVMGAQWRLLDDPWTLTLTDDPVYRFDIRANAFCHQMVRAVTACLVGVGAGRFPVSLIASRLADPHRDRLPTPAPAGGLSLVGVGFPEFAGGPSGFVS
jgi:tRNA pseudouridine38-40 synthase